MMRTFVAAAAAAILVFAVAVEAAPGAAGALPKSKKHSVNEMLRASSDETVRDSHGVTGGAAPGFATEGRGVGMRTDAA